MPDSLSAWSVEKGPKRSANCDDSQAKNSRPNFSVVPNFGLRTVRKRSFRIAEFAVLWVYVCGRGGT